MIRLSDGPHSMLVATPWTWARICATVTAGRAGAHDLATLGTRAVPSDDRGDARRPVGAQHARDAQLVGGGQDRGVHLVGARHAAARRP